MGNETKMSKIKKMSDSRRVPSPAAGGGGGVAHEATPRVLDRCIPVSRLSQPVHSSKYSPLFNLNYLYNLDALLPWFCSANTVQLLFLFVKIVFFAP